MRDLSYHGELSEDNQQSPAQDTSDEQYEPSPIKTPAN